MSRSAAYPPTPVRRYGMLDLSHGHKMYWEESGFPLGQPVVCLHGGPGGGSSSVTRQIFNPQRYRVIQYDQRGCGRSTPFGDLTSNNTAQLVADVECLRQSIGVDSWLVCGSSWGATLACEYAKHHPDRVQGLLLYGSFLGRQADIDAFLTAGSVAIPKFWRSFADHVDAYEAVSILSGYRALMSSTSPRARAAALSWARYEIALTQYPGQAADAMSIPKSSAWSLATISAHYFHHRCFLGKSGILSGLSHINHIPVKLVHGSHDAVCAVSAARELVEALPYADLAVVKNAGHVPLSGEHWSALSRAADELANEL